MSQRATSNTPKLLLSQIASDAEGQSRRDAVYYPDSPGLPQSFVHYGPSTTSPSAVGVSFPGAGTAGYGGPSNSTFTHYAGSLSVPSFSGTPAPHLNTMANTYDPVQQYAGDQNTSVTMSSSFNNFVPPQGYVLSSQIATAPTSHGNPHLVAAASSDDLSEDDLWTMYTTLNDQDQPPLGYDESPDLQSPPATGPYPNALDSGPLDNPFQGISQGGHYGAAYISPVPDHTVAPSQLSVPAPSIPVDGLPQCPREGSCHQLSVPDIACESCLDHGINNRDHPLIPIGCLPRRRDEDRRAKRPLARSDLLSIKYASGRYDKNYREIGDLLGYSLGSINRSKG